VASNRCAFSHTYATTVGVKLWVVDLRRNASWYRVLFDLELVPEYVKRQVRWTTHPPDHVGPEHTGSRPNRLPVRVAGGGMTS
jgi:hypothetical protein